MNFKTMSIYGLSLFFIIQLTGCAPMSGTMKIIDQSLPQKPKWTNTIPQSRDYEYFVGISDNKNTLDEAKRAAISDALSDALTRKGIEVSSKYEKMSTHERNEFLDEILTAGTARLGLNHVAWYTEVWEHYRNKSAIQKYRAFVLMRSRKLEQDGLVKTVLINLGNRLETTWYSTLFPGWG